MDLNRALVLRKDFKSRINELYGIEFENLFCSVMEYKNWGFRRVKPYGASGDRKNDGYVPTNGIYFQCYSPEIPHSKQSEALNKLRKDLKGLIHYWRAQEGHKVNEFFFVFNDKYSGVGPDLSSELMKSKALYNLDVSDLFLARNIEEEFTRLSEIDQITVLYSSPPIDISFEIEVPILGEVIRYIQSLRFEPSNLGSMDVKKFDRKMNWNGFDRKTKGHFTSASYTFGELENYFRRNSEFSRQALRDMLNKTYTESRDEVLSQYKSRNIAEQVLCLMQFKLTPNEIDCFTTKSYRQTLYCVLAYFFEPCDIFEEPPENMETEGGAWIA